jgi:hypothetical protein
VTITDEATKGRFFIVLILVESTMALAKDKVRYAC